MTDHTTPRASRADRPLPCNLEAERTILVSIITRPEIMTDVAAIVQPADWHGEPERIVYARMMAMHSDGEPILHALLVGRLSDAGDLERIGGMDYLIELMAEPAMLADYTCALAREVRQHAERRRLITHTERMLQRSYTDDPADVAAELRDVAPGGASKAARTPIVTCMADVEPRSVSWLWPGRIPLGRITLLVGRPGEGKSFVTTDAAARISTGTPWPDGSECPRGSIILLSAEDDPGDTIRPRLDAHYADCRRIHLLSAVRRADAKGEYERIITLADVDAIEAVLRQIDDVRLIVVDPIGSYLGSGTDAHRDNEVRGVLAPIAAMAERYGPAVLVVAHRRKSLGSSADDSALGSRAFTGIARAVWHLSRDPDSKSRRLLLPGKNNLAREGDGLAFSIVGEPARIAWERDPVTMHADDALAAESAARKPGPEAEAHDAATTWLRAALADGPRLASDLKDDWINGQGGSKRTLERAKQSLGIEAYRAEHLGPWWWRFLGRQDTKGKQLGDLGDLSGNTGNTPLFDRPNPYIAKLNDLGDVSPDDPTDTANAALAAAAEIDPEEEVVWTA